MENGIKETLEKIRAIGLFEDGLEEKLSKFYEDPVNGPMMAIYKMVSGQNLRFELNVSMDYNLDKDLI